MWRKAYDLLLEWKDREDRMPLIVRGVRQCGKTYILRRFGEEQYGNMVYVNLESEKGMHRVFDRDLDPRRIVRDIASIKGVDISECKTYEELPEATRNYIEHLEELAGVRISIVSVGADRDQTILHGWDR